MAEEEKKEKDKEAEDYMAVKFKGMPLVAPKPPVVPVKVKRDGN